MRALHHELPIRKPLRYRPKATDSLLADVQEEKGGVMTAKECFNRITFGRENAVKRLAKIDRLLRGMVEKANNHGDCIINVGNGYYRPTQGDAV